MPAHNSVSTLWKINLTGCNPKQLNLTFKLALLWARNWIYKAPFQPKLSCNFDIQEVLQATEEVWFPCGASSFMVGWSGASTVGGWIVLQAPSLADCPAPTRTTLKLESFKRSLTGSLSSTWVPASWTLKVFNTFISTFLIVPVKTCQNWPAFSKDTSEVETDKQERRDNHIHFNSFGNNFEEKDKERKKEKKKISLNEKCFKIKGILLLSPKLKTRRFSALQWNKIGS